MHEEMVKPCKYFQQGICMFSENICWNSHKIYKNTDKTSKVEFKCKYCGNTFSSKNELMKHRKTNHMQNIAPCRDKTNCKYGEVCWYQHENNLNESSYIK